jgi:colicin import membrane protein
MRVFYNHTIILATIFSTIIHFFIMTILDTFTLIPKTIAIRPGILMVDLIPLEKKVVTPKIETKVKEKTEVKKEVKKDEKKNVKKVVKKEVKAEVKKEEIVIPTKQTKVEKEKPKVDDEQKRNTAIEEIARKVAERPVAEEPTVTSSQLEYYFGMVREKVKRFWVIPDTLSEKEALEAVIVIEIDKNGLLIGSRVEKSSGNPYFDQSAMRAITKAAPFPPPLGKAPLEIGLKFQPN